MAERASAAEVETEDDLGALIRTCGQQLTSLLRAHDRGDLSDRDCNAALINVHTTRSEAGQRLLKIRGGASSD